MFGRGEEELPARGVGALRAEVAAACTGPHGGLTAVNKTTALEVGAFSSFAFFSFYCILIFCSLPLLCSLLFSLLPFLLLSGQHFHAIGSLVLEYNAPTISGPTNDAFLIFSIQISL